MRQDVDRVDVKHDRSTRENRALGIGMNLSETPRALKLVPDGITVNCYPSGSMRTTLTGIEVVDRPLRGLFCDLVGADVQLAPGGVAKGTSGLSVQVDPSGTLTIEVCLVVTSKWTKLV